MISEMFCFGSCVSKSYRTEEKLTRKFCAYCSASIFRCGCKSNRCDTNEIKLRRKSPQRNFGLTESAYEAGGDAAGAGGFDYYGPKTFFYGEQDAQRPCYFRSSWRCSVPFIQLALVDPSFIFWLVAHREEERWVIQVKQWLGRR